MKKRKNSWIRRHLPMVAAIGALVLLILILVLVIRGCSADKGEGMTATAFSTGTALTLPVEAELNEGDFVSYGGYQFETKKSLSKMSSLLAKSNEGVTVTNYANSYGTCVYVTLPNESGVDSWVLYQKDPANTQNYYIFMAPYRQISLPNGTMDLLLPLQYITDASIRDSMGFTVQLDTVYTCGLDNLEEEQTLSALFRGFYEESGLYTVTSSENGFTLVPKGDFQELIFRFDEAEGNGQFMISVPEDEEPEITEDVSVAFGTNEPVALSSEDALTVSELLISANYKKSANTVESVYQYQILMGGTTYELTLEWNEDSWNGFVCNTTDAADLQYAILTTRSSCTLAAVMAANAVGTPARDIESWPANAAAEVAPMTSCMQTSTDVNVRTAPSTDSDVLMTMTAAHAVAVCGSTDDGWYEIWFGDTLAYMSADYLEPCIGTELTETGTEETV